MSWELEIWSRLRVEDLSGKLLARSAPLCAKCRKHVTLFLAEHDFDSPAVVFVIECHGEREVTKVTYRDLASSSQLVISPRFGPDARAIGAPGLPA